MSIDPGLIHAETHTEVGRLLQRDAAELVERWARRAVKEQPHAKRVHHVGLVDHLVVLLQALGRSLTESDHTATLQHCRLATIHGEERWETGWSLPEVVRDYQILRLVILEYLEELEDIALDHRAVMAIGLALDEAIAASVTIYVSNRDEHFRTLQEERAERDREIQAFLQQKTEILQEVDRRKNEFLATLGHEMRNPLAPLWHATRLLELSGGSDPSMEQVRDIIKRQVQQLTRLADDLLDISRIAQNKIELRRESVDIATVLAQAVQTSAPHLKARHHELVVASPSEPLRVNADPTRLVQIIVNLLNNAAKYTDPGGRVWLTVGREGENAVIRVRDNGTGIPAEMLPHVFEMFTQGNWTVERSQGGLGIGLALVRRLVELHGGTIAVTSAGPRQGSEFVVTLPAEAADAAGGDGAPGFRMDASTAAIDAKPRPRSILVVDDNVDSAKSLALLLQLEGHRVRMAHDGPTTLEIAGEFRPDLVLLDIGLPSMDGHEVARRLKATAAIGSMMLVALTGYGLDEDRRRSEESGFDAHLVKPVDLDELRQLMNSPGDV